jgi:hypothetical protein
MVHQGINILMSSMDKTQIGRLALRAEGDNWNAYYALVGTMDGAILLGSIRMGAVTTSLKCKKAFMDLMQDVVADIIAEKTGTRPTWDWPIRAPEHERSGNA